MLIDLSSEQYDNARFTRTMYWEQFNWSPEAPYQLGLHHIYFILKVPTTNTCVFHLVIKKEWAVKNCSSHNFWYNKFLRDAKSCFYYMTLINLMLIVISNYINHGPETKNKLLTIWHNNIQGFITIKGRSTHFQPEGLGARQGVGKFSIQV